MKRLSIPLTLLLGSLAAGTAAVPGIFRTDEPLAFEELTFTLEANVNDVDGEVVLHAETGLPIQKLALVSPTGEMVQMIDASMVGGSGLSEVRLESGEYTVDEVRATYPPGTYVVRALTTKGKLCSGTVELSHELPARWAIHSPLVDDLLPRDQVVVEWSHDPSATRYSLEIEDDVDEQRLLASPQPGQTTFEVPSSLLLPDTEYQVVVIAYSESGNRVIQERFFRTLPEER